VHHLKRCSIVLILALPLAAQNPVVRQGASPTGAIDFTGAAITQPLRIASTLPTSCTAGELLFLLNAGVYQCVNGTFAATGNGGTWGTINGTVSNQTDLWNALQAKQPLMTIGTAGQYVRGDGSLGTLAAGSNVTLTPSGNTLTIAATGGGGGGGLALSGTPSTNDLLSYNGSAAADSGVAVTGGVVTAAGFQTTGTGGTQITISEGNAPATPATNQRVLWADSALHWLRTTDYNGVNWMLMRSTAPGGSGNGVKWNGDGSLGDLGYTPPALANANTWTAKQAFVPGGSGAGLNVGAMAGNPNAPTNGDLWYSSASNTLNAQINGATVSLGSGGGGSGANANGYYFVSQSTNAPTNALNLGALPSGLLKASVSGNVAAVSTVSTARAFGYSFNGNGSALAAGATGYLTVPFACTISAWNMSVDQGTAAVDIWKLPIGTSIPNSGNSITASAMPAISSGTSIHSTTLTAWTTAVAANDIVGINLKTVGSATFVNLTMECDQ
jgi:hypothetical protein